jgi:hypothetical protein
MGYTVQDSVINIDLSAYPNILIMVYTVHDPVINIDQAAYPIILINNGLHCS